MKKEKKNQPVQKKIHLEFDIRLLENEIWLTTEETMVHLSISRSTIYRLRKQKSIPNLKIGNSNIYPKHLLNKLFIQRAIRNVK
jgi:excisionase family DNA binding protein